MALTKNGDPVRYRVFYDMYRAVADAAGVPKEVWNARARHGGGTEERASGASIEAQPTTCRSPTWRAPGVITSPVTSRLRGAWRGVGRLRGRRQMATVSGDAQPCDRSRENST
jgi:hypothetical protein